jgi:hypothetical protein
MMGLRCGRVSALGATLLVSMTARDALAQPTSLDGPPKAGSALALRWTAPPECPAEARVQRDIQTLVGRDLTPRAGVTANVSGVVSRDDAAWIAELSIERPGDAPSVRRVEGKTCREVSDAAAVIIALALDAPRVEPPDAAPVAPPPPPSPPRPPSNPPFPARPSPEHPFGGAIAVVGGLDFTALPAPSAGFGLAGGLVVLERNRFELRLMGWIPQTENVDPAAGVDVSLFAATLRYCRVLSGDVARLTGCAGFEGGVMVADAFGFASNDRGLGRWLAPELAAALEVHATRQLGVTLELEGLVPIARDHFLVDEDRVYRPGAVDGRVLLGAFFRWP